MHFWFGCYRTPSHYALRWDLLNRAGCPEEAERAACWAEALDQAQQALRLYA